MKTASQRNSTLFFLLGFNIISAVAIMLLLATLGFTFRITISKIYLPLALGLSCLITFFSLKFYSKESLFRISIQLFLLLFTIYSLSFIIAAIFYDISFDGQTYHQETIIQLKNGWNPFHEKVIENVSTYWITHYAKGAEIPQSVVYSFFNKIEIGKATNILLIFASFFLCLSALLELNVTSGIKSLLLAGLFAFNTISVCQALTYFVDGQLASLLLCLLSLSVLLFLRFDKYKLLLCSFCIILLLNIKFTAFGLVGIIGFTLLAILYRKNRKNEMKKIFTAAIASSVIGILLAGFNPYITNTLNHRNPFFPLAGKGKTDIFSYNCPNELFKKNRVEKFFISIYSKTEDISGKDNPQFKIPFAFENRELEVKYATRIGGLGFWFSGIFTLASVLLIILLLYYFNSNKIQFTYLLLLFLMFLVSIFMISEPWWARYIPQVWFYPLVIILFAEQTKNKKIQLLSNAILFCIMVNVTVVCCYTALFNYARTKEVKQQIAEFKKQNSKPIRVDFGLFLSNRIRLDENRIPYTIEIFSIDDTSAHVIVYSEARYKL